MRLYLSGPMSSVPDNNAPAFQRAALTLRQQGHDVVVPHELDEWDTEQRNTWGDFLGRDVQLIANGKFDGIVLLRGWEGSKGAKLEAALALLLGLKVYRFGAWGAPERFEGIRDYLLEVL